VALFSEVGENVTLTVQLLMEAPQLFVSANGPLVWIREITNPIAPVLVIVTICGALVVPTGCGGNVKTEGDRVADGTAASPLSATVCGLPAELSLMVRVPFRVPVAVGANVTGSYKYHQRERRIPVSLPRSELQPQ
jgi:hypothetical protein